MGIWAPGRGWASTFDFVIFVAFHGGTGLVENDTGLGAEMFVSFDDVVRGGGAGQPDAVGAGDVIDDYHAPDGEVAGLFVAGGGDVDVRDVAPSGNIVALDVKALHCADVKQREVAVAAVVDEAAVADDGIAMVFVHQAFAVVDSVFFIRAPIAVHFVVIGLDHPPPAAHFQGAIVIGGRAVTDMNAGDGGAEFILGEANDVVSAEHSIPAKPDGTAAGVVDVIVADDSPFAEAPRMRFRCAVIATAAGAANAMMIYIDAGAVVVVKEDIEWDHLLFAVHEGVVLHQEIVVTAFRDSIVGDQGVFGGVDADGGSEFCRVSEPAGLTAVLLGYARFDSRGIADEAAEDEAVDTASVALALRHIDVSAVDTEMDYAAVASRGRVRQDDAFES